MNSTTTGPMPTTGITPSTIVETPIPTKAEPTPTKAPGFEYIVAIFAISILYIFRRIRK